MVSAIGSSPVTSIASSAAASTAAIEAQIARDKKELSNCVNCESAGTKQGQADIQTLSSKINIAEARLKEISTAKPANQPTGLSSTSDAAVSGAATNSNSVASIAENKASSESAANLDLSDTSTGRFVDVFA